MRNFFCNLFNSKLLVQKITVKWLYSRRLQKLLEDISNFIKVWQVPLRYPFYHPVLDKNFNASLYVIQGQMKQQVGQSYTDLMILLKTYFFLIGLCFLAFKQFNHERTKRTSGFKLHINKIKDCIFYYTICDINILLHILKITNHNITGSFIYTQHTSLPVLICGVILTYIPRKQKRKKTIMK